MLERLHLIKLAPTTVVDIGCGTGFATVLLQQKYRRARIVSVDFSTSMLSIARKRFTWPRRLRGVCANTLALPLADNSCELVLSNFVLHWCSNLAQVFAELQRILKPGGLLMFSTLGPDTLTELRQSWAAVDQQPHVHTFIDMHDVGDKLLQAQFADPVMDVERFTLTYQDVNALQHDLKMLGATNALKARRRGLLGKHKYQAFLAAYEQFRTAGLLPATYEIVYGHAWSPAVKAKTALAVQREDGSAVFPLNQLSRRR